MSKKRNTRNTNKSLKALKAKRKKYAVGGIDYSSGETTIPATTTKLKKETNSSLYSDPALGNNNIAASGTDDGEDVPDVDSSNATVGLDGNTYATEQLAEEANQRYIARLEAQQNPVEVYQTGDADAPVAPDLKRPTMSADNLAKMTATTTDPEAAGTISDDIQKLTNATRASSYNVGASSRTAKTGEVTKGATTGDGTAETFTADKAKDLKDIDAAQSEIDRKSEAGTARATKVDTAKRDKAAEEAAKGTAAKRDEPTTYATGAKTDDRFTVGPVEEITAETRKGVTIPEAKIVELTKLAKERGLNPNEALSIYRNSAVDRKIQTGRAAEGTEATLLGDAPARNAAQADFLEAADVALGLKQQIADAGEAGFATRQAEQATRIGDMASATTSQVQAQKDTRTAITDDVSAQADAEQTAKLDAFTLELSRQAVTGQAVERQYEDRLGVPPQKKAAQAEYFNADFTPKGGNTDIDSIPAYEVAATRTAQVAEVSTKIVGKEN